MDINHNINIEKLTSFIDELSKIKIIDGRKDTANIRKLDQGEVRSLFADLQVVHELLTTSYSMGMGINVWATASLKRDEVRNSKVLAWCLNPKANHGQKDTFLKQFLFLLPDPFPKLECMDSYVVAESCILGSISERVDIEIEANQFLLIIEVKIDAVEGPEQLTRYLTVAEAKAKDKPWLVVYLTRNGELPSEYSGNPNIVPISWRQVSTKFMQLPTDCLDDFNRGVWLIQQFAQYMNSF